MKLVLTAPDFGVVTEDLRQDPEKIGRTLA